MVVYYKLVYFCLLFYANKVNLVTCDKEIYCEVRTRIDSGWICGKRRLVDNGTEYASFRGIPYARQPVGDLRFQELRPATPWNHYLDTTEERPVCPQHDENFERLIMPTQGMSEACIYANVHVPLPKTHENDDPHSSYKEHGTDDSRFHKNTYEETVDHPYRRGKVETTGLPILVYIHGGGFQSGSGDSDMHGPEYLVSRGVIVITFNYRINVFGFLYLNSPKIPGNQGLRDMVTLLRWVQRNARAFGGDPGNVTLMGQSAGATLAHLLSLSKETDGLFRRVILSSGTANPGFYTTSPLFSKLVATLFLYRLGINSTDPDDIHDQLIRTPLKKILLANSEVQYATGIISFSPVAETPLPGVTRILDDDPTELIKRGRGNQYPLIVGFNTAECEFFRPRLVYLDLLGRIEANPTMILNPRIVFQTPPNVSLQLAGQAIRRYFKKRFTYDELVKCCTETFFQYPAFQLVNLRASMDGAPVFLYQYSYNSELNFVKEAKWLKYKGTAHAEDFVKIFRPNAIIKDIGKEQLPLKDDQMKDWIAKFIVNFMRCSNPTCPSPKTRLSQWSSVKDESFNYQRIDEPQVYQNTGPTPEQWDMIEFFEYIEAESRRAIADQGTLAAGTSITDVFMNNMTALLDLKRPKYPLAIVYIPRPQKIMKFKSLRYEDSRINYSKL